MTVEEFSNTFDLLLGQRVGIKGFGELSSKMDLVFDEYEKSLLLTEAQKAVLMELYDTPLTGTSYEGTEQVRRQLNKLVKEKNFNQIEATGLKDKFIHTVYEVPEDCWFIVYEQCSFGENNNKCLGGKVVEVTPVTHDAYSRTIRNPFRGPDSKRVLRLDRGDSSVELVSSYDLGEYTVRYLTKPSPIVLCPLTEDLAIDGVILPLTCQLDESVHQTILLKAVSLALATRQSSK